MTMAPPSVQGNAAGQPRAESRTPPETGESVRPEPPSDPDLGNRESGLPGRVFLLGLLLVLGWFFAWDLRAVLLDQRPGLISSDTTVSDLVVFERMLDEEGGFGAWVRRGHVKGPLAALLAYPIDLLLDDPLLATRLLGVLCHTLTLALLAGLVLRLGGTRGGTLWAVLLLGALPASFGWFRMDFHEALVAPAVVGTLLALTLSPAQRRAGPLLGLAVGLGVLSKLSFPIFVAMPGLYHLAFRVRGLRAWLGVVVAALVALGIASFWLVPSFGEITQNMADSTHASEGWLYKMDVYLLRIPGSWPLLLGGILLGLLAAVRRRSGLLAALTLTLPLVIALLLFVFDPWTRYIVPLFPVAAALAGLGLSVLPGLVRGRWRALLVSPPAAAVLAACVLGPYVHVNLRGLSHPRESREFHAGLVAPDRRPYQGYASAVARARHLGWAVAELPSGPNPAAFPRVFQRRGVQIEELPLQDAISRLSSGKPVGLIFIHDDPMPLTALRQRLGQMLGLPEGALDSNDPASRFVDRQAGAEGDERGRLLWVFERDKSVDQTFTDPDGVRYSVIGLH